MQVGDNSLNDLNFSVDHEASKKNGVITEYFEDGAKMSEITYEQGVKNGISKSWFSNGQLKEERGYLNDRFHGAYRVWAKTGLPRISGFYSNGKQHGEWILYDQDGEPMPSVYYEDGVEVTRVLPSLRDWFFYSYPILINMFINPGSIFIVFNKGAVSIFHIWFRTKLSIDFPYFFWD